MQAFAQCDNCSFESRNARDFASLDIYVFIGLFSRITGRPRRTNSPIFRSSTDKASCIGAFGRLGVPKTDGCRAAIECEDRPEASHLRQFRQQRHS